MVKKSKKSKSKRVSLRKKYKIIRKVKEHHKKKAKEAKKLGFNKKRKVEKDPGIPNDWPFKEQELKALEARRARALEELEQKKAARKERAKQRKLGIFENDDKGKVASNASSKDNTSEETLAVTKIHDHSERAFYKELVRVIEASDVILEVLDARDPLGTRCVEIEKMILKSDPTKRIILLLNKIDLVPREALEKWLKYLRGEYPTVAFKCSTQQQRAHLGWKSTSKSSKIADVLQTSDCLGAETLIKLLKNYSRSHEMKLSITVGVVGLPNVGKSSLINSLKRSHVANVGSTPGVTRSMQEIHLDKNVKLLDCPGIVMLRASEGNESIVLHNCKRIEKLDDPVSPVKKILDLCPAEKMVSLYKIPIFETVDDFLYKVAIIRGKLKKGGVADIEATARIVLHDWNEGKIQYFTLPPARDQSEDEEAVIVAEFGKRLNLDEIYKSESSFIGTLPSVEEFNHLEVSRLAPLVFDEQMFKEDEPEPPMQEAPPQTEDATMPDLRDSMQAAPGRQNDKLYDAVGIFDPRKQRAEKKRRKGMKKETAADKKKSSACDMDADYDFKEDYKKHPSLDSSSDEGDRDSGSDGGAEDGNEAAHPMEGVDLDE